MRGVDVQLRIRVPSCRVGQPQKRKHGTQHRGRICLLVASNGFSAGINAEIQALGSATLTSPLPIESSKLAKIPTARSLTDNHVALSGQQLNPTAGKSPGLKVQSTSAYCTYSVGTHGHPTMGGFLILTSTRMCVVVGFRAVLLFVRIGTAYFPVPYRNRHITPHTFNVSYNEHVGPVTV